MLTASDEELGRRFEREPDHWFPLNVILGANRRFPSLVKLLPKGLVCLQIDMASIDAAEAIEKVEAFVTDNHGLS